MGIVMTSLRLVKLCDVSDVPVRGARTVWANGKVLGVFKTQSSEIFVIDNQCPHKKGPLSEGIIHDNRVTCPLHSWVIDLSTGQVQGEDEGCVKSYEAVVRDGQVYVELC